MTDKFTTQPVDLAGWLAYLETLHFKQIDLTLERVKQVFDKLNIQFTATIVTVAGTNGKGTTCAALECMALYLGKRVGVFSSPHLVDYKERVRVNGQQLSEADFCQAFQRIEKARGDISLTPFEYGTLAAFCILDNQPLDVLILEVGLGGRLDAVNIVDPDLAVITSIGLDHQEYLGTTKEQIALEKAGILREKGKAVIGDIDPPQTLIDEVARLHVDAKWQQQDFGFVTDLDTAVNFALNPALISDMVWECNGETVSLEGEINPSIPLQNLSTAFACAHSLGWPVNNAIAQYACDKATLPGRFQIVGSAPLVVLDVAHNSDASQYIQQKLLKLHQGNLHIVVGMLADKDLGASLSPFKNSGASWYIASLPTGRTASTDELLAGIGLQEKTQVCNTISEAFEQAKQSTNKDDCILVFGSFYTVAAVLPAFT